MLDSDFKLAKLRKPDGSIVEVSKEKLSVADKQAIERAFAVIEVSARREKEWIGRLAAFDDDKKEIQSLIDQANQPAPKPPTIDLAKQMVEELRTNRVAEKQQREVEEAEKKGTIHPSQIEVLETRVVERRNAKGEPMDMIEGKFIRQVGRKGETIVVYVGNEWHFLPYQIRLQMAQNIWATWVLASNAEAPDHARVDIKDLNGNGVGGSKLLGGSLSWVSK